MTAMIATAADKPTEKPYAGKFADQRRAERRARLIAAGFDLLGTAGTTATTVRAVCEQAGLTSRYFYESFPNLDALLVAVFDEVMARTMERATAAVSASDGTIPATVAALGEAFVEMTLDDPKAMRIGFIEAWGSEALMRRRVQTLHDCANLLSALVAQQRDITDQRRDALTVAAFVIVGGLLEAILGWLDGSLTISREVLIQEFAAAAVAAIDQAVAEGARP
jgi:AcrR family transcriptional regulator